jgi:hypothetical protein
MLADLLLQWLKQKSPILHDQLYQKIKHIQTETDNLKQ